jgi:hypothetical protein
MSADTPYAVRVAVLLDGEPVLRVERVPVRAISPSRKVVGLATYPAQGSEGERC